MGVTINGIIDGVTKVLQTKFPESKVYGEEIKQKLTPPCFFVKLLVGQQTQELNTRYRRAHSFDIHYFSADRENEQMHDMAEQLYECMRLIDIGSAKYRGISMTHEIVDGVLHFFVDYTFHVRHVEPADPDMQTMEQEGSLK